MRPPSEALGDSDPPDQGSQPIVVSPFVFGRCAVYEQVFGMADEEQRRFRSTGVRR